MHIFGWGSAGLEIRQCDWKIALGWRALEPVSISKVVTLFSVCDFSPPRFDSGLVA